MTGDAYVPPMLPMLDNLPGVVGVGLGMREARRSESMHGLCMTSSRCPFMLAYLPVRKRITSRARSNRGGGGGEFLPICSSKSSASLK